MISQFYERKVLPKICNCCCSLGPIQKQREKIVPLAKGIVLEIGIGSGLNLDFYDKKKISKIYALDPHPKLTEMSKKKAKELEIDLELFQRPADEIPLKEHFFDTVVCTYTLCSLSLIHI